MTTLTSSTEIKTYNFEYNYKLLDENEIQIRLNDKIVQTICAISFDSQNRKQNFRENVSLLGRGIFYAQDYYHALKETNQDKRVEYFRNRDSFYNGYLNPKYFEIADDKKSPSGKMVLNFILKKDADPIDALRSIQKDLSMIGCGEVCQVAQYEAVLDIIGPEKFRILFSSDSSSPLMIGSKLNENPIARLRTYILEENPNPKKIRKGDMLYFYNVDSYVDKHLNGQCRGYNVSCVDDSEVLRFTTLGLPPQGLTTSEMKKNLIHDYNCEFMGFEYMSEKLQTAFFKYIGADAIDLTKINEYSQISSKMFKEQYGGKIVLLNELDAQKITRLATISLEDVTVLFNTFKAKKSPRT